MSSMTARVPAKSSFLSASDADVFARNGFFYVPGCFNASEMRDIARWTQEVQDWEEVPGRHMAYYEDSVTEPGARVLQRIENFIPYHADFRDIVSDWRMLGAVGQLFGEPAVLFKDKINFKLPGGDGYKPHQDQQAGWGAYAPLFITVLVTIDEQTIDNGCLEMVAGRHKQGLIGSEWEPLSGVDMADMQFVAYPSKPGDVMYFDSFAPHRSLPNRTPNARRVLYVTYNALSHGNHRATYYADKRKSFPPDIERAAGTQYRFRV